MKPDYFLIMRLFTVRICLIFTNKPVFELYKLLHLAAKNTDTQVCKPVEETWLICDQLPW